MTMHGSKEQRNSLIILCYFQVIFLLLIFDAVRNLEGATVASAPADHQPENQLEEEPYNYPKNEESYTDSRYNSI